MALIVEDGSIVSGAESYATVAEADAYLGDRGIVAWTALDVSVKESSLRRATDYMTERYRRLWLGTRVSFLQSLDWPRYNVPRPDVIGYSRGFFAAYPYNEIPVEIVRACIELANRASTGTDLNPDTSAPIKQETVGPITTIYEYGSTDVPRFKTVEGILSPFLGSATLARVVRA